MKAWIGRGVRAVVHELGTWALRRLERLADALAPKRAPPSPARQQDHADERTARRMAEDEHGGISSAESAARWERGDNPGGLHHKAVRREGPEHQRPDQEEPQERRERVPGGEPSLPATRRGG